MTVEQHIYLWLYIVAPSCLLIITIIWLVVKHTRKPKQKTFIYCEKCGNELCSTGSFVSDTYDADGNNHVLYKCSKCGHAGDYNFDIAPVPIKWSEIHVNKPSA